jgi:hypothetical protein
MLFFRMVDAAYAVDAKALGIRAKWENGGARGLPVCALSAADQPVVVSAEGFP